MGPSTVASEPWDLGLETEPGGQARVHALVVEHFDFIWRLLRRFGVPESGADDAAQQVFLTATKRLSQIAVGSEQSYLFGVALRVAADERKKRQRRREATIGDDAEHVAQVPAPDELLEQRRARELMDHVLETMPTALRSVLVLYEMEEMTMVEIATMLGIPPGSVASRLRRARAHFHDYVRRYQAKWELRRQP
jgi:RNA polymerase sigma-70 factor (ECF subfamily)